MSDTDWRTWVFQTLEASATLAALLPQNAIFGAGALLQPPAERPFLAIKFETEVPGPFPGVSRGRVAVYANDEPGDYLRLTDLLWSARAALCANGGRAAPVRLAGAVACIWQGDSGDLSDPDLGTIFRTSTFDLQGKDLLSA